MAITSAIKSAGVGGFINDGLNVWCGVSTYKSERQEGKGVINSAIKGVGDTIANEIIWSSVNSSIESVFGSAAAGPIGIGVMAAYIGATVGSQFVKASSEHTTRTMSQAYRMAGRFGSGYFNMTDAGYTMRQRSLNAIRSNGLNSQSVLGNEARTYFRSTEGY